MPKDCLYCNAPFEPNPHRPDQKFCSDAHRSAYSRKMKKEQPANGPGLGETEPPAIPPTPVPTTLNPIIPPEGRKFDMPENLSPAANYIIKSQEREISRLEDHIRQLTQANASITTERDSARTQLAELRTDQKIKEIEGTKPKGLNGLFPTGLEGVLNNPFLGPVIAAAAQKLVNVIPAAPGGPAPLEGGGDALNNLIAWLQTLPEDVQMKFGELMAHLVKVEQAKLGDTMGKMINLLSSGSTITQEGQGQQSMNATMNGAYGY